MTLIDLSITIRDDVSVDPPRMQPSVTYIDHHGSAPGVVALFPGLGVADLPDGEAWAVEKVTLSTHNGTHLDAPWHFASTMDDGKTAITIDQVPLDWCFRPGVKLDFRDFADGHLVTAEQVQTELGRIGYKLNPFDIVLVNTRAGERLGESDYLDAGCGMGREATMFLLNQGIRITGTDAWSWDAPFSYTAKRIAATGNTKLFWEGHKVGREIGYCHMEKLTNLDQLPPFGFKVACFPIKIFRASAGWTRAVAIVED